MSIQTVCGSVEAHQMTGPILPHEHILVDFSRGILAPGEDQTISVQCSEEPCHGQCSGDEGELELFRAAGGATVCELSCTGLRWAPTSPVSLAQLSRETGVNIVHATGFYCTSFLPETVHRMSVEDMTQTMVDEVTVGVGGSEVRCGVVYVGCSWPLHSTEEKALRAAATLQRTLGTPITVHPGRHEQSPFQILDILESSGAHNNRTFPLKSPRLLDLASRGPYLNISLFGKEVSHYQYDLCTDMPTDAQRIQMVQLLLESGHKDKILVSHDVVCKHELRRYGGNGYTHLLDHMVPKMVDRGIDQGPSLL